MSTETHTSLLPDSNDSVRALLSKLLTVHNQAGGALTQIAHRAGALPQTRSSSASYNQYTTRTKYTARVDCSSLRLVFCGFWGSGGSTSQVAFDNTVTIKVALETSAGTVIPVWFNSSRSLAVTASGIFMSDPIGVTLAAGDTFWLRIYKDKGAGTYVYYGRQFFGPTANSAESTGEGAISGDYVDSGTVTADSNFAFEPAAILGQVSGLSDRKAIVCIGDSIANGSDYITDQGSWVTAGFADRYPVILLTQSADRAFYWTTPTNVDRRLSYLTEARPRYGLCELGTNDIFGGGYTLAQCKSYLQSVWAQLRKHGCTRVYQATILPRPASSSDNWRTVAGQTVHGSDSIRTGLNSWIRALGDSNELDGYIEAADAVESARDSGKWACESAAEATVTPAAGGTGATTLTASGSPGWTTDQYRHYTLVNVTSGTTAQVRHNTSGALYLASALTWLVTDTLQLWRNRTLDGIHPSTYGHGLIAAAQSAVSL